MSFFNDLWDLLYLTVDRFFKDYFKIVIGSGPDYPLKPNPTSAEHVLNVLNADPAQSYFVGDTEYDILTAKNSNMKSLAVSWGMISREELLVHRPDHIFDEPKKFLDFFFLLLQEKSLQPLFV